MKVLGIIPSRYGATRFPGKPLADIGGKTMVERVYRQAIQASCMTDVIVATEDERIIQHVLGFGGKAMMTRADHQTGTDRCAEVARMVAGYDIVVNIQGDEPFILPEQIDAAVQPLIDGRLTDISTLAKPIENADDIFNPNIVKVVLDNRNCALYFSRSPIPHLRGISLADWFSRGVVFYKHIGLYAFRSETILEVTALPPGIYEQAESLEQLRWLANGYPIAVGMTDKETLGIDVPEDIEKAQVFLGR